MCITSILLATAIALPAQAQDAPKLTRLTTQPTQDGFPTWSPDGSRIAFSRNGGRDNPEVTGLWVMDADGGNPRQLTRVPAEHPDWSPDGRYIAFDGDYGSSVQLVSADGGTPIRIVPESIPVHQGGFPEWSPDGERLAVRAGVDLWLVEPASGRSGRIYSPGASFPIPTVWSPHTGEIYLYRRAVDSYDAAIWAISPTGGSPRQVTPEPEGVYRYADLSPDGSLLCVTWCEGRACDLWVMSPDGGPRIQVTSHPALDEAPAWSPDGTGIAFVSTRTGSFDIWLVDVDVEALKARLTEIARETPER